MVEYHQTVQQDSDLRSTQVGVSHLRLMEVDGEPYQFYIDRFRAARDRAILVDAEIDMHEALEDGDLKLAKDRACQGLSRVGAEVSSLSDVNVNKEWRGPV